jgi:hypothetical protein
MAVLPSDLVHEGELLDILRHLVSESGARSARIAPDTRRQEPDEAVARLGLGMLLFVRYDDPEPAGTPVGRAEQVERAARALREELRRQGRSEVPLLVVPDEHLDHRHLILARIQQFLHGLITTTGMRQAILWAWGDIVSSAEPLEELDKERMPLLVRQLERAAQSTPGTSHGELVRSDLFARSFYYGAALVVFAGSSYSEDFLRHRCRQVTRELGHLLSLLEDGPDSPARQAPPPGSDA